MWVVASMNFPVPLNDSCKDWPRVTTTPTSTTPLSELNRKVLMSLSNA